VVKWDVGAQGREVGVEEEEWDGCSVPAKIIERRAAGEEADAAILAKGTFPEW
jgi:hypothetical protein